RVSAVRRARRSGARGAGAAQGAHRGRDAPERLARGRGRRSRFLVEPAVRADAHCAGFARDAAGGARGGGLDDHRRRGERGTCAEPRRLDASRARAHRNGNADRYGARRLGAAGGWRGGSCARRAALHHDGRRGPVHTQRTPAGTQVLVVRKLGYALGEIPVDLRPNARREESVRLGRAVALDSVRILAKRPPLAEFEYNRRTNLFGHFLTLSDIQRSQAKKTSDLLSRMGGYVEMGRGRYVKMMAVQPGPSGTVP